MGAPSTEGTGTRGGAIVGGEAAVGDPTIGGAVAGGYRYPIGATGGREAAILALVGKCHQWRGVGRVVNRGVDVLLLLLVGHVS